MGAYQNAKYVAFTGLCRCETNGTVTSEEITAILQVCRYDFYIFTIRDPF